MHNLLILSPDAEQYESLLLRRGLSGLDIHAAPDVAIGRRYIADAEIILGMPGWVKALLPQSKNLAWVQSTFAGIDALCTAGLPKNYTLTGVKGIFGPLISEYVFAHILANERHLFGQRENQTNRRWREIPYRGLKGVAMGICGYGSIGQHIAHIARCFGMRVTAYKRSDQPVEGVEQLYSPPELNVFLRELEYLVITLPATAETRGLIDAAALACMKPSAVLINVGRGQVVVESALIHALEHKHIKGAVLDVFEQEPLPPDSPLWSMSNVIVTPHNSGVSFPSDIVDIFCDNYARYMTGQRLEHVIDLEKGY
ncbi:MAG: D-2-hydroxyacid dehydrogenase [Desulfobacteraceae bacterium]|nr:D-2-hydroxyacid dehydrogenase [Desulfobacteraceae bacterium]